jgi:hypothetical protein
MKTKTLLEGCFFMKNKLAKKEKIEKLDSVFLSGAPFPALGLRVRRAVSRSLRKLLLLAATVAQCFPHASVVSPTPRHHRTYHRSAPPTPSPPPSSFLFVARISTYIAVKNYSPRYTRTTVCQ